MVKYDAPLNDMRGKKGLEMGDICQTKTCLVIAKMPPRDQGRYLLPFFAPMVSPNFLGEQSVNQRLRDLQTN
jgi:hypothetical protein